MGTIWVAMEINAEVAAWLRTIAFDVPSDPSRAPTGTELKAALGKLQDCSVTIRESGRNKPWRADIHENDGDAWTVMVMRDYPGDDQPVSLTFEKGHEELIERILRLLTPVCGPLVLVADTGEPPILIEP